jgi:hypothetical protein
MRSTSIRARPSFSANPFSSSAHRASMSPPAFVRSLASEDVHTLFGQLDFTVGRKYGTHGWQAELGVDAGVVEGYSTKRSNLGIEAGGHGIGRSLDWHDGWYTLDDSGPVESRFGVPRTESPQPSRLLALRLTRHRYLVLGVHAASHVRKSPRPVPVRASVPAGSSSA